MISRVILILTVIVSTIQCSFAQTGQTAGEFPYSGELTGARVYVRCGPGDKSGQNNYYVCAHLNKDDRVTVVGERKGWLRILAPKGCFSVISQKYVTVDPQGKTGIVTGNNVWARPAGTLRTANFNLGQRRLKKSERVQVLGTIEEGTNKWYKIESPQRTYFWVFARYVKKIQNIKEPEKKTDISIESAVETPKGVVEAQEKVPPAPAKTEQADPLKGSVETDTLQAFRDLQKEMIEEYKKPLQLRDLESLSEKFKKLPLKEKSPLKPYVNYYITYLQTDMERKQGLSAADILVRSTAEKQKKFDLKRAENEIQQIKRSAIYTTTGIIEKSHLFSGKVTGIKRYLVYNVATRKLNAYIEADASLNLDKYIGQHVGIYGTSRYDKSLAVEIITASQVVVLKKQIALPVFPQPIVRNIPKPTYKPPYKPTGKLAGNVITVKNSTKKKVQPKVSPVVKKQEKPKPKPAPKVKKTKKTAKPKPVKKIAKPETTKEKEGFWSNLNPFKKNEKTAGKTQKVLTDKKAVVKVKPVTKPVITRPAKTPAVTTTKKQSPKTYPVKKTFKVKSTPKKTIQAPITDKIETIQPISKTTAVFTPKKATDTIIEKPISIEIEAPKAHPLKEETAIPQIEASDIPAAPIEDDKNPLSINSLLSEGVVILAPTAPKKKITIKVPSVKPRIIAVLNPNPVTINNISFPIGNVHGKAPAKKIAETQPTTKPAQKSATTKPANLKNEIKPIIQPVPLEKVRPAAQSNNVLTPLAIDIPDIDDEIDKPIPPVGLLLAEEKIGETVDESEYE